MHNQTKAELNETIPQQYGRRCADAMNAHDVALYAQIKRLFEHYKIGLGVSGVSHDRANSQFNESYRENRIVR